MVLLQQNRLPVTYNIYNIFSLIRLADHVYILNDQDALKTKINYNRFRKCVNLDYKIRLK